MSISVPVQLAQYLSPGNVTTSGALAVGTSVASGSTLYVIADAGAASAGLSIIDSGGNTWQSSTVCTVASGSASQMVIFWRNVTTALISTDTITVNRTPTGSLSVWINVTTGVDQTTPLDNGGITPTANSVTALNPVATAGLAVSAGSLVVMGTVNGLSMGTYNATSGSGFTVLQSGLASGSGNPRGGGSVYQIASTATTLTPSVTTGSAQAWGAVAIAFKAAAAGTPASGTGAISIDGTGSASGGSAASGTGAFSIAGTATARGVASGTGAISLSGSGTAWGHKNVGTIGDSLTFRALEDDSTTSRESITRGRWVAAGYLAGLIYWKGVGGKSIVGTDSTGTTTLQNITSAVAQLGPNIDTLIIALGTNDVGSSDATFAADMNTVLNAAQSAGVVRLIWVNIAFKSAANTNALHFNPIIASTVAAFGNANYIVADWAAFVHNGRDESALWNVSDATHMTATGYALRDQFLIDQVQGNAAGTGSISISGSGTAKAPASASGSISISATGTARGAATATGSVSISGTGTALAASSGSGSVSIAGTGVAAVSATGSGSISISGTGTSRAQASGTASIAIAGTGNTSAPASGSGSVSIAGSGTGAAPTSGSASISISATGTATSPSGAAGTGAVSIGGTGSAKAASSGSASVSIAGTASATVPVSGSGSISIAGAGAASSSGSVTGLASISIAGASTAKAAASGLGAISLSASGTGRAPSAGTGAISIAGVVLSVQAASGTGSISISASGNAMDGSVQTVPTIRGYVTMVQLHRPVSVTFPSQI